MPIIGQSMTAEGAEGSGTDRGKCRERDGGTPESESGRGSQLQH